MYLETVRLHQKAFKEAPPSPFSNPFVFKHLESEPIDAMAVQNVDAQSRYLDLVDAFTKQMADEIWGKIIHAHTLYSEQLTNLQKLNKLSKTWGLNPPGLDRRNAMPSEMYKMLEQYEDATLKFPERRGLIQSVLTLADENEKAGCDVPFREMIQWIKRMASIETVWAEWARAGQQFLVQNCDLSKVDITRRFGDFRVLGTFADDKLDKLGSDSSDHIKILYQLISARNIRIYLIEAIASLKGALGNVERCRKDGSAFDEMFCVQGMATFLYNDMLEEKVISSEIENNIDTKWYEHPQSSEMTIKELIVPFEREPGLLKSIDVGTQTMSTMIGGVSASSYVLHYGKTAYAKNLKDKAEMLHRVTKDLTDGSKWGWLPSYDIASSRTNKNPRGLPTDCLGVQAYWVMLQATDEPFKAVLVDDKKRSIMPLKYPSGTTDKHDWKDELSTQIQEYQKEFPKHLNPNGEKFDKVGYLFAQQYCKGLGGAYGVHALFGRKVRLGDNYYDNMWKMAKENFTWDGTSALEFPFLGIVDIILKLKSGNPVTINEKTCDWLDTETWGSAWHERQIVVPGVKGKHRIRESVNPISTLAVSNGIDYPSIEPLLVLLREPTRDDISLKAGKGSICVFQRVIKDFEKVRSLLINKKHDSFSDVFKRMYPVLAQITKDEETFNEFMKDSNVKMTSLGQDLEEYGITVEHDVSIREYGALKEGFLTATHAKLRWMQTEISKVISQKTPKVSFPELQALRSLATLLQKEPEILVHFLTTVSAQGGATDEIGYNFTKQKRMQCKEFFESYGLQRDNDDHAKLVDATRVWIESLSLDQIGFLIAIILTSDFEDMWMPPKKKDCTWHIAMWVVTYIPYIAPMLIRRRIPAAIDTEYDLETLSDIAKKNSEDLTKILVPPGLLQQKEDIDRTENAVLNPKKSPYSDLNLAALSQSTDCPFKLPINVCEMHFKIDETKIVRKEGRDDADILKEARVAALFKRAFKSLKCKRTCAFDPRWMIWEPRRKLSIFSGLCFDPIYTYRWPFGPGRGLGEETHRIVLKKFGNAEPKVLYGKIDNGDFKIESLELASFMSLDSKTRYKKQSIDKSNLELGLRMLSITSYQGSNEKEKWLNARDPLTAYEQTKGNAYIHSFEVVEICDLAKKEIATTSTQCENLKITGVPYWTFTKDDAFWHVWRNGDNLKALIDNTRGEVKGKEIQESELANPVLSESGNLMTQIANQIANWFY